METLEQRVMLSGAAAAPHVLDDVEMASPTAIEDGDGGDGDDYSNHGKDDQHDDDDDGTAAVLPRSSLGCPLLAPPLVHMGFDVAPTTGAPPPVYLFVLDSYGVRHTMARDATRHGGAHLAELQRASENATGARALACDRPDSAIYAVAANPARYGAGDSLAAAIALAHGHCLLYDLSAADMRIAPDSTYATLVSGFLAAVTHWPAVVSSLTEPDYVVRETLGLPNLVRLAGFSLGLRSAALEVKAKALLLHGHAQKADAPVRIVSGLSLVETMSLHGIVWGATQHVLTDEWFPWLFVDASGVECDYASSYVRLLSAMRLGIGIYSRLHALAQARVPTVPVERPQSAFVVYGLQTCAVMWRLFAMWDKDGLFPVTTIWSGGVDKPECMAQVAAVLGHIGEEARPRLQHVRRCLSIICNGRDDVVEETATGEAKAQEPVAETTTSVTGERAPVTNSSPATPVLHRPPSLSLAGINVDDPNDWKPRVAAVPVETKSPIFLEAFAVGRGMEPMYWTPSPMAHIQPFERVLPSPPPPRPNQSKAIQIVAPPPEDPNAPKPAKPKSKQSSPMDYKRPPPKGVAETLKAGGKSTAAKPAVVDSAYANEFPALGAPKPAPPVVTQPSPTYAADFPVLGASKPPVVEQPTTKPLMPKPAGPSPPVAEPEPHMAPASQTPADTRQPSTGPRPLTAEPECEPASTPSRRVLAFPPPLVGSADSPVISQRSHTPHHPPLPPSTAPSQASPTTRPTSRPPSVAPICSPGAVRIIPGPPPGFAPRPSAAPPTPSFPADPTTNSARSTPHSTAPPTPSQSLASASVLRSGPPPGFAPRPPPPPGFGFEQPHAAVPMSTGMSASPPHSAMPSVIPRGGSGVGVCHGSPQQLPVHAVIPMSMGMGVMPWNAGAGAPAHPGGHGFGVAYSSFGNGVGGAPPPTPGAALNGAGVLQPYASYNSYPPQQPVYGHVQGQRAPPVVVRPSPLPPPPPGLWQAAPKRRPVVIGSAPVTGGIATGSRYDVLGTP